MTKTSADSFRKTILQMLANWKDVTPEQRAEAMRLIAIAEAGQ